MASRLHKGEATSTKVVEAIHLSPIGGQLLVLVNEEA